MALGIQPMLSAHAIAEEDLEALSIDAFEDTCHQTNIIPVSRKDLLSIYKAAL